jgi:hypothetical protein
MAAHQRDDGPFNVARVATRRSATIGGGMTDKSSSARIPGRVATTKQGSEARRTYPSRSQILPRTSSSPRPQARARPIRARRVPPGVRVLEPARTPRSRFCRSPEPASKARACRGGSFHGCAWTPGRQQPHLSPSRGTFARVGPAPEAPHSLSRSGSSSGSSAACAGT